MSKNPSNDVCTLEIEREAFEIWWESFHNGRQIACDYVEEDNSYSVGYANAQWVAWQAANRHSDDIDFAYAQLVAQQAAKTECGHFKEQVK